jgi:hypothetical protein
MDVIGQLHVLAASPPGKKFIISVYIWPLGDKI